jgi:hypothetical protein
MGRYQIGFSILDTRHLQSSIHNRTEHNLYYLLQTHQFCIGDQNYFKNASRGFCFGQSKHIALEDLNTIIQNLVSKRDIILVVHGGGEDLTLLYVLDTQKAAQYPLDLNHRYPIKEMLNLLQCPFGDRVLRDTGNDANFTLRALLLIATVDAAAAIQPHLEYAQKSLLSAFEEISRGPVPLNDRHIKRQIEKDRARRRREKRRAKRLRKRLEQERAEDMDPDALTITYEI